MGPKPALHLVKEDLARALAKVNNNTAPAPNEMDIIWHHYWASERGRAATHPALINVDLTIQSQFYLQRTPRQDTKSGPYTRAASPSMGRRANTVSTQSSADEALIAVDEIPLTTNKKEIIL